MPHSFTEVVGEGKSFPLGAACQTNGVNFSVYSKNATAVELLLFNRADDARPAQIISLDPEKNRTYYYWHVFVPGVRAGQIYGYRVSGPYLPEKGFRFDARKVLLDPYGKSVVVPSTYSREAATEPGDYLTMAMKSAVVDTSHFNWEGDVHLGHRWARPSSTKCTWAASPAIRVPELRPTSAAPIWA